MNKLIPIGCTVSAVMAAWMLADSELVAVGYILTGLAILQILGMALIAAGVRRAGAYVVMTGSLPMIPLGLVGAFGARQVLDSLANEEFEQVQPGS